MFEFVFDKKSNKNNRIPTLPSLSELAEQFGSFTALKKSYEIARGEDFLKKAEKKVLRGRGLFGLNYKAAASLFKKAINCFKTAKSWDQAGFVYVRLAQCQMKLCRNNIKAALYYADAADCYKKTDTKGCDIKQPLVSTMPQAVAGIKEYMHPRTAEAITCLEQAIHSLMGIGILGMSGEYIFMKSAEYFQKIAELCEQEQNLEQAMHFYDKAADLFQSIDLSISANWCKRKIAKFAAQLEQYQRAIDIYEDTARQSLNDKLEYGATGVSGDLLKAGICELCKNDIVAITNALKRYKELDPTFSGTRQYKLLEEKYYFTDMAVTFYNLGSEAGLKKLDEYLLSRSYITGYQATNYDLVVHAVLAKPPPSEYVNVSRWYNHIEAFLRIS